MFTARIAAFWVPGVLVVIATSLGAGCGAAPPKVLSLPSASFGGIGDLPGYSEQSQALGVAYGGSRVVGSSGYRDLPVPGTDPVQYSHHQGKPARWDRTLPGFPAGSLVELASYPVTEPGGQAMAISDNGTTAVGYAYTEPTGPPSEGFDAVRWETGNSWNLKKLPALPGWEFARAVSVNEDGFVTLGYSQHTTSGGTSNRRGCVWIGGSLVLALSENLPGAVPDSSWPAAISPNALVIVGRILVQPGTSNDWKPCVWRKDRGGTGIRKVDPIPSDPLAGARATWGRNRDDRRSRWEWGFLPTELPLLPGTITGRAFDLSHTGHVIVGSCSGSDAVSLPCKWTWKTITGSYAVEPIEDIPAMGTGTAAAVSSDGSVIVGYTSVVTVVHDPEGDWDDYVQTAWIWSSAQGRVRLLKEALDDEGLTSHADWNRLQPTNISADGHTVVGFGVSPAGLEEGWVATLTIP